jgi:hypothetical protein
VRIKPLQLIGLQLLDVILRGIAQNQLLRQVPAMALHAGMQCLPKLWVLIFDIEGRFENRKFVVGGFCQPDRTSETKEHSRQ